MGRADAVGLEVEKVKMLSVCPSEASSSPVLDGSIDNKEIDGTVVL